MPALFYRAREDSYRYWLLARLAHQKPVHFTYHFYDPASVAPAQQDFVFYIDREGGKTPQKNVFSHESIDIAANPLFEKVYREYFRTRSKQVAAEGNRLVAYHSFIDSRWDLANFLQYKPLTPLDFLRGCYYGFMTRTGFTNAYRYDHILSRSDRYYEYDVLKNALNINSKDWESKAEKLNLLVEKWLASW